MQKIDFRLPMHPTDYEAMTQASKALNITPEEFCKLVIHFQSHTILKRIAETTAPKGGHVGSLLWR
jgi:hypothetical protein